MHLRYIYIDFKNLPFAQVLPHTLCFIVNKYTSYIVINAGYCNVIR